MIRVITRNFSARSLAIGAVSCVLLYLASLYSYLLFHSLAEVFSILIAFAMFLFSWHTREYRKDHFFQFLGISFLFIGLVDLVHTLAYKGMGVFPGYDANLPTQLWIAARYLQGISLLIAPFFINRKTNLSAIALIYAAILLLLFASIFAWGIFPDCFVEGVGLTSFKILSEYVISALLLLSVFHLALHRQALEGDIFQLIVLSIVLTIVAELAFTTYLSVFGFSNLLGHLFKIGAFYALYQAIILTGLTKPFSIMFRELKASEIKLERANLELEDKVSERTSDLVFAKFELEVAYKEAIKGWVKTLDMRDHETEGHTMRVAYLFESLAEAVGVPSRGLDHYHRGALLHDIGKMGIPDEILHKPGPLSDDEWEIMRQHPVMAYEMLSEINYLKPALDIPYCHHEKWDGSGYPRGLTGAEIPLVARIFAVVDVFDALTSDRPYRKAWAESEAIKYLHDQRGAHFEPRLVDAFFEKVLSPEKVRHALD